MNFKEEYEKKRVHVEEIVKKYLPEAIGYQKTVIEAMNYSILSEGKRIRPMLMEETYLLFGGKSRIIEPFMAAMEMIHTYSLVHDDLPAMDNDEYRRGRKTTHVVFGEGMAILAGDGLLNLAFETASKAFEMEPENSLNIGKAIALLGNKAGIYGMIGGQTADIESVAKGLTLDKLNFIHLLKTAALIEASMMIGAILSGASEEEIIKTKEIASGIGMAFQIQDDILDVTSTMEVLGKPVHSDDRNQKTTYVTLKGLEEAGKEVVEISSKALEGLHSLNYDNKFLADLIAMLIYRDK